MEGSSLLATIAKRLEGKVALITGGASGIGESTARLFARHGAKVVIADVQDTLGRSVCDDIGLPDAVSYVHCDVTNDQDVESAVNDAVSKHGRLDIMFSNAGVSSTAGPSVGNVTREDFTRVFEVNVYGAMLCARHAARVMVPERKGSIVFTSSVASVTFGDVPHVYSASKAAVVGLTKNLCVEMGQHGVRVNCISPFGVATPMTTGAFAMNAEAVEEVVAETANLKGVVLKAEDVAEAALYLGSDDSRYVSGLNLVVDGGYIQHHQCGLRTTREKAIWLNFIINKIEVETFSDVRDNHHTKPICLMDIIIIKFCKFMVNKIEQRMRNSLTCFGWI